jgi:hypothetical protein
MSAFLANFEGVSPIRSCSERKTSASIAYQHGFRIKFVSVDRGFYSQNNVTLQIQRSNATNSTIQRYKFNDSTLQIQRKDTCMMTTLADSLPVIRQIKLVVISTMLALTSCGGDQYVPEKVPSQLESVKLPLSGEKIEEILASNNASAFIGAVKENQSHYETTTKANYAKLTALDPCVKRFTTVVSEPLSEFLYWDDEKNGFFKKKISTQKPLLTRFALEFALPINSGERVPVATAFEFPLTIDRMTNPSRDYKNFVIEAYPYYY